MNPLQFLSCDEVVDIEITSNQQMSEYKTLMSSFSAEVSDSRLTALKKTPPCPSIKLFLDLDILYICHPCGGANQYYFSVSNFRHLCANLWISGFLKNVTKESNNIFSKCL